MNFGLLGYRLGMIKGAYNETDAYNRLVGATLGNPDEETPMEQSIVADNNAMDDAYFGPGPDWTTAELAKSRNAYFKQMLTQLLPTLKNKPLYTGLPEDFDRRDVHKYMWPTSHEPLTSVDATGNEIFDSVLKAKTLKDLKGYLRRIIEARELE